MNEFDKKDESVRNEIYSKPVRAGKITYFFDVKPEQRLLSHDYGK